MVYTRRFLLTLMGLGALGIAIPACPKMLGQILFSPQAPQVPPHPLLDNAFTHGSKSLVVMVHGTEVPAMVEHGIEWLGGLGKLALTGTRTLLKPNMVGGRAPPITTDPRVVQALGTIVRAEKPASLVSGEMSAVMALPTWPHLERTGMLQPALVCR